MEWLNYHHLPYHWMVARTGSVAAASTELKLAPPTISVQIRRLEGQLGEQLLRRSGRHVVPIEMGRVVYRYADEIFALGRELVDTARGRPTGRPMHVVIAELSVQRVDVMLADAPISPTVKVRAYNHLLGETGLSFLGVPRLVREYRPGFPESLRDAPMLLPTPGTPVRRTLDQWFDALDIRPRVVGEFDDSELRWEFGATGIGVFSAPLVLETHLGRLYNVQRIGCAPGPELDLLRDLGREKAQTSGCGRDLRGGSAHAVREEHAGPISAHVHTTGKRSTMTQDLPDEMFRWIVEAMPEAVVYSDVGGSCQPQRRYPHLHRVLHHPAHGPRWTRARSRGHPS